MNRKQLLGISVAAVLSIALISLGGIEEVSAKKDPKFSNLHFKTADCRIAMPAMETVVENQLGIEVNPDGTLDGAQCSVKAWFDEDGEKLGYKIKVNGMEAEDTDDNKLNDIGKMHFHQADFFMGDNPDNPVGPDHILNIFKLPRQDDNDLAIMPNAGIFLGLWDQGDTYVDPPHDNTLDITLDSTQEILCQGEAFLMIHGVLEDDSLPGFIKASIQPTPSGIEYCESKGLSTTSELLP